MLIKVLIPLKNTLCRLSLTFSSKLYSVQLTYLHLNHSICKKFLCTYVATPFPLNAASLYPSLFIVYRSQDHLKVIETHFGMEPQKQLVVWQHIHMPKQSSWGVFLHSLHLFLAPYYFSKPRHLQDNFNFKSHKVSFPYMQISSFSYVTSTIL